MQRVTDGFYILLDSNRQTFGLPQLEVSKRVGQGGSVTTGWGWW